MPWRTLSSINIGFIGHVVRYVPSSTYLFLNDILHPFISTNLKYLLMPIQG
ncbi:MAG: hypothetical protein PUI06_03595 [Prevotella sp.]|nr:hypothetical protein [Prevotella sp.]